MDGLESLKVPDWLQVAEHRRLIIEQYFQTGRMIKVSEDSAVYVGDSLLQLLLIFSQRRAEWLKREESKKIEFSRGFRVMTDIHFFNS